MKKFIAGTLVGILFGAATATYFLRPAKEVGGESKSVKEETHEEGVRLTKERQANAGIVITKPEVTEWKSETKAFGRVLDAAPLAALLAESDTAQSALNASTKEFERLKTLGEDASARAMETAEAAMKRDRIAVDSAQARLLGGWGRALASRTNLPSLTQALLAQEVALARVDVPAGETLSITPDVVRIVPLTGNALPRGAEVLGVAPSADPQAQGQAFLVLIRDGAPPPGTALRAWFANESVAEHGFRLPRTAVVQYAGDLFVFVQTGEESFQRKRVEAIKSERGGVLVNKGLEADDRVVATGAQQLLSEELKGVGSTE